MSETCRTVRMVAEYHAAANWGGPSYRGDVITVNAAWAEALIAAGLAEAT